MNLGEICYDPFHFLKRDMLSSREKQSLEESKGKLITVSLENERKEIEDRDFLGNPVVDIDLPKQGARV